MKYIKRNSGSNNPQSLVEYLQGGILIRFNEIEIQKEEETMYQCNEFWFPLTATVEEIEEIVKLTDEHKKLLK